jgi:hypothetical protein
MAAYVVLSFTTRDYDEWKERFDSDPAGRKQSGAVGHVVSRSADDPSEVFVRVEFAGVDEARAFRQRLLASGVLENTGMNLTMGPTAIEAVEATSY